jgi:CRISPR-associated protein Cmr4
MKAFKIRAYGIECLTNLHVGSGGDNFGIVDKEVQRDQVDEVPIIHASSLKGAMREFFDNLILDDGLVNKYFGSQKNSEVLQQGLLRIFEGRLLAIPVRGIGSVAGYLGTSSRLIKDYNKISETLDPQLKRINIPATSNQEAVTEFATVTLLAAIENIGDNIALFTQENDKSLIKSLPIIARNSLENGQSENLWYEEVIPRGSMFYFFIAIPEGELQEYITVIEKNLLNNIVQIGANATIGYGYCKISKL